MENQEIYTILTKLQHPNLPQIELCIATDSKLIFIEQFINGVNLEQVMPETPLAMENEVEKTWQDIINKGAAISRRQVFCIIDSLSNVLVYLHSQKPPIIHRDIKPSNVMLTSEGNIYLIDFDASRIYLGDQKPDTQLLGTVGHAAPEQYGFLPSSPKTDLYALGVLYNELLTGQLPNNLQYEGKEKELIKKCTAFDPKNRYQSVEDFQKALHQKMKFLCEKTSKIGERDSIEHNDWKTYLPPGFRTLTPWKMIWAIMGYMLIFTLGLSITVENPISPFDDVIYRITAILTLLNPILFLCNYANMQDMFPFFHQKNQIMKIVLWIVYAVIIIPVITMLIGVFFTLLVNTIYTLFL